MGEHKNPKKANGVEPTEFDAVRRMDHRHWLVTFAQTLEISPKNGVPMTPFRAGCISRLRMAAEYIDLLRKDLTDAQAHVKLLQSRLASVVDERNQFKKMLDGGDDAGR
jgi:hypothetical protein